MKEVVSSACLGSFQYTRHHRGVEQGRAPGRNVSRDRFSIDGKALHRASGMDDRPREKLSAAGHRKLVALAAKEKMAPDQFLAEVISC